MCAGNAASICRPRLMAVQCAWPTVVATIWCVRLKWSSLDSLYRYPPRTLDHSSTGFLDYARGEQSGVANQAWKDSQDSMFYADGRFPRGPLAVVEVQGYAYAALNATAELAAVRDDLQRSAAWRTRAERLCAAIEGRFWVPELNFYAIAIDGDGKRCSVHASNAGHLLYCGVPSEERGAIVAKELLSNRFSSTWGIRTLASGEVRSVEDHQCVGTGWNVLEVTPRLGFPDLHDHDPHRGTEHLDREALRRVEQRAINRADIVANVQYRDVDSLAGGRLPRGDAGADEQQPPEREAELHKSARQPYVRYRTEPPARSGYCS